MKGNMLRYNLFILFYKMSSKENGKEVIVRCVEVYGVVLKFIYIILDKFFFYVFEGREFSYYNFV